MHIAFGRDDTDYLDDKWILRASDFRFGALPGANNAAPTFWGDNLPMDMTFDPDRKTFEPFRKAALGKRTVDGKFAQITEADEHAF